VIEGIASGGLRVGKDARDVKDARGGTCSGMSAARQELGFATCGGSALSVVRFPFCIGLV